MSRAAYDHACAERDYCRAEAVIEREKAAERYDALLEKYHDLRLGGANVAPVYASPPASPLSQLGPKTQAALREMSVGLGRKNVDAMRAAALRLHTIDKLDDAQVALLVRRGERTNRNGAEP